MRGRVVGAAAGLALVAGCGLLAGSVRATPAGDDIRLLQLNLCGHSCGADSTAKVRALVGSLAGFRPTAVSLNEVCRPQLEAVLDGAAARGWAMHGSFLVTRPGGCGAGVDYGIAVLTRPRIVDTDVLSYAVQEAAAVELRGLLCAEADLGGRRTRVCSTHLLDQGNDPSGAIRGDQVAQAAATVASSVVPVVLMGDFNLRPRQREMAPLYSRPPGAAGGGLTEVDQGAGRCRCGAATRGSAKLDYIFVTSRDFRVVAARTNASRFSDHAQVRARVAPR